MDQPDIGLKVAELRQQKGVVNAYRALIDQSIRYPLSIPFIR